jgi:hypothetical protein
MPAKYPPVVQEEAKRLNVSEADLLKHYRGLGPMPSQKAEPKPEKKEKDESG